MRNVTIDEIKVEGCKLGDLQIIETLMSLAIKKMLGEHELKLNCFLKAVLAERHGLSELDQIEKQI
ncbi:hypothetical protein Ping_0137 [Psychromonas ingrahamii 37]|uniref:Uncharacterized protein n=1 Tax=Psychromonas ingrahamii (strain DSM 17664 / CCUG 51855 / 37) TaxID=357804 RepID=A1SR93_PSYIN|nr:hypothetical protein [Psychromonas ingrahamii]ABM02008.1 hypothetical protein Ping_0137 [Psychromonas ingrahamii 37]